MSDTLRESLIDPILIDANSLRGFLMVPKLSDMVEAK